MENPKGLEKFQATDREECGVIINGPFGMYVQKLPNMSENDDGYAILKDDVNKILAVLSDGEGIVGFIHTHLPQHDCSPSDDDLDGAKLNPNGMNLIYKPDTGETCWYGVEDAEEEEEEVDH
jgi:proteasome lid subunit RPN8/RPN11